MLCHFLLRGDVLHRFDCYCHDLLLLWAHCANARLRATSRPFGTHSSFLYFGSCWGHLRMAKWLFEISRIVLHRVFTTKWWQMTGRECRECKAVKLTDRDEPHFAPPQHIKPDWPAAKGGPLHAKAVIFSLIGSNAAKTCHNHPKAHVGIPCAMHSVVLCRKSTKFDPLDIKIWILVLLSHNKSSSAALEISSDFGRF